MRWAMLQIIYLLKERIVWYLLLYVLTVLQILSNAKLAKLLQRMLAYLNFMNQKGGQVGGMTLESLVKMMQTKGKPSLLALG